MRQSEKSYYIHQISLLSDKYGNELMKLMDECHKDNLNDITCEEARKFYEKLIEIKGENL